MHHTFAVEYSDYVCALQLGLDVGERLFATATVATEAQDPSTTASCVRCGRQACRCSNVNEWTRPQRADMDRPTGAATKLATRKSSPRRLEYPEMRVSSSSEIVEGSSGSASRHKTALGSQTKSVSRFTTSSSGTGAIHSKWRRAPSYMAACGTRGAPLFIHFQGPSKGKLVKSFEPWLREREMSRAAKVN